MKLIMAIIKPFKIDDVREALTSAGIDGLTITEVKGYGRQVVVGDELAERAVEVIQGAAFTGKIGDGKIFVVDVDQAVRIRTGETGAAAI
jgi:nitrogen regulatory protein P-II 2